MRHAPDPCLPQARRGVALILATGAALLATVGHCGCSLTAPPPTAATTRPALPAFVYPADPPIVDAADLASLLVRLDAEETLVWVFDDTLASVPVARLLADARDELRARGIAIVGLYAGLPDDWSPKVVPMLRSADANFICAVANPTQRPNLGLWLSGNPKAPENGVYLIAQDRRVLRQVGPDESAVRGMLDSLRKPRPVGTQPGEVAPTRWARVRIIDLTNGSVLASAEGQGAEPADLTEALARRLLASGIHPTGLAILPLRQTGPRAPGGESEGMRVADDLGRRLSAAGWSDLVPAAAASDVLTGLGRSPLDAEFDPMALAGQTPWKAILVGTIRVEPASAPP